MFHGFLQKEFVSYEKFPYRLWDAIKIRDSFYLVRAVYVAEYVEQPEFGSKGSQPMFISLKL